MSRTIQTVAVTFLVLGRQHTPMKVYLVRTSREVNEARGGLILATGRVRSKKKNEKKKHEIPPNAKKHHHGINTQQPGDRDHLETACDETRPTR